MERVYLNTSYTEEKEGANKMKQSILNEPIEKLDYELRKRNWSVNIHSGKIKGINKGMYAVGQ